MQIVRCPTCGDSLSEFAEYCVRCSKTAPLSEINHSTREAVTGQDASGVGVSQQTSLEENETPQEPMETVTTLKLTLDGDGCSGETPQEPIETVTTLKLTLDGDGCSGETPQESEEATQTLKLSRKTARRKSKPLPTLKPTWNGARASLEKEYPGVF